MSIGIESAARISSTCNQVEKEFFETGVKSAGSPRLMESVLETWL